MYSTGDLPSTRARNSPGSRCAARRFQVGRRLPADMRQVGGGQRVEAGQEPGARRRRPQAFQQQVVEAERQVEGRIAPPGAFRVQEHRAVRAGQDVLRADVAVHQGALVGLRRGDQRVAAARARSGCARRGGDQVGLQPDVEEDRVGGKRPRPGPAGAAVAAWMRPSRSPTAAAKSGSAVAVAQLRLPQRMVVRRQVLPSPAGPDCRVLAEQGGRGAGHGRVGLLHPARLVEVAVHRRAPVRGDPQLGQRAFHADRAGGQVDAPDVGGHAAGQALALRGGGVEQVHATERGDDLGGRGLACHAVTVSRLVRVRHPWMGRARVEMGLPVGRELRSGDGAGDPAFGCSRFGNPRVVGAGVKRERG